MRTSDEMIKHRIILDVNNPTLDFILQTCDLTSYDNMSPGFDNKEDAMAWYSLLGRQSDLVPAPIPLPTEFCIHLKYPNKLRCLHAFTNPGTVDASTYIANATMVYEYLPTYSVDSSFTCVLDSIECRAEFRYIVKDNTPVLCKYSYIFHAKD